MSYITDRLFSNVPAIGAMGYSVIVAFLAILSCCYILLFCVCVFSKIKCMMLFHFAIKMTENLPTMANGFIVCPVCTLYVCTVCGRFKMLLTHTVEERVAQLVEC